MGTPTMARPAFIPDAAYAELLANDHHAAAGGQFDPLAYVRLFTIATGDHFATETTWLACSVVMSFISRGT